MNSTILRVNYILQQNSPNGGTTYNNFLCILHPNKQFFKPMSMYKTCTSTLVINAQQVNSDIAHEYSPSIAAPSRPPLVRLIAGRTFIYK